jgi:hypothetical protein
MPFIFPVNLISRQYIGNNVGSNTMAELQSHVPKDIKEWRDGRDLNPRPPA